MNAINKMLSEIKYRLPSEILKLAFVESNNWNMAPVSLDEMIMSKVIRPRVLTDANLVGGQMVMVTLDGLTPQWLDNLTTMYQIPGERVMFRTIVSVLSVCYYPMTMGNGMGGAGYGSMSPNFSGDVSNGAQRLGDSYGSAVPISNATCDVVGHNTVMIKDQYRMSSFAYVLRCMVENEENLNNINPRSYHNFAKLCEYAVKSYIYKTLIIKTGKAVLSGGQDLSELKTYIDTLADAEENYQTFLREKWAKTAFMNDVESYARFLKVQLLPGL
jgi:hypothetical protein